MTRSRSTPRTRRRASTTERRRRPSGRCRRRWNTVPPLARANASSAAGVVDAVARQVLLAGRRDRETPAAHRSRAACAGRRRASCASPGSVEVARRDPRRRERIGRPRSRRCRATPDGTAHTDAVKPEKRCSGSPGLSTDSGMTLNWTSGRPPRACSVAGRAADLAGADRQRTALPRTATASPSARAAADCGRRR